MTDENYIKQLESQNFELQEKYTQSLETIENWLIIDCVTVTNKKKTVINLELGYRSGGLNIKRQLCSILKTRVDDKESYFVEFGTEQTTYSIDTPIEKFIEIVKNKYKLHHVSVKHTTAKYFDKDNDSA